MISNLRHQLKLMGKEDKLQEVLEEDRTPSSAIRSW